MNLNRVLVLAAMATAAATVAVSSNTEASAASPTCSGTLEIAVHGQHVVGDYVIGTGISIWPPNGQVGGGGGAALPGGPGAHGHFTAGVAPGASFCLAQSQSPGAHPGP